MSLMLLDKGARQGFFYGLLAELVPQAGVPLFLFGLVNTANGLRQSASGPDGVQPAICVAASMAATAIVQAAVTAVANGNPNQNGNGNNVDTPNDEENNNTPIPGVSPDTRILNHASQATGDNLVQTGIDVSYLDSDANRFSNRQLPGFYLASDEVTALAESPRAVTVFSFAVDYSRLVVLQLTNPDLAAQYNYRSGLPRLDTQAIAMLAYQQGYNGIEFPSVQNPGGTNLVILGTSSDFFNSVVTPISWDDLP
jgi:RES domain